jgi:hypothetical protein
MAVLRRYLYSEYIRFEETVSAEKLGIADVRKKVKIKFRQMWPDYEAEALHRVVMSEEEALKFIHDDEGLRYLVADNKVLQIAGRYSAVYKRMVPTMRTVDSIRIAYSNRYVRLSGSADPMQLGVWWLGSPKRLDCVNTFFDPSKPREVEVAPGKMAFNWWNGLSLTPKKGSWRRMCKHIYVVLCKRDPARFKYVIRWYAHLVQRPGEVPEVVLVFRGKKGGGKTTVGDQFIEIFGENASRISNRDHLTGRFNAHHDKKIFILADEAYYPGDKKVEGVLKSKITDKTYTSEAKFMTPEDALNCAHITMSTNNKWVVPATMDERRYFVGDIDNRYAEGEASEAERTKYFGALWAEMNGGGREAMLYELLNVDIKSWHPRQGVPKTAELHEQIEQSLPGEEQLVLSLLDDGVMPANAKPHKDGDKVVGFRCSAEQLCDLLDVPDNKRRAFMSNVGGILPKVGAKKVKCEGLSRWDFPSLEAMRAVWVKTYSRHEWTEEAGAEWRLPRS